MVSRTIKIVSEEDRAVTFCVPCYQGCHYACINKNPLQSFERPCHCDTCDQIRMDVKTDIEEGEQITEPRATQMATDIKRYKEGKRDAM